MCPGTLPTESNAIEPRPARAENVPGGEKGRSDEVIRAVMFDFGGVISSSPFEAFEEYERRQGLPLGTIRRVNSTDPDRNAWARLERGEVDLQEFCLLFEEEARALGSRVDAMEVIAALGGEIRPEMVAAVRHCSGRYLTACLTNNFRAVEEVARPDVAEVFALFDSVFESSKLGVRKPDPAFYLTACRSLGVEPDEVVFLDDLGINLKPARELGMHTIKVVSPATALRELFALVGEPGAGHPVTGV